MARHVYRLDLPPSLPHPTTSFPRTVHVTPAPNHVIPTHRPRHSRTQPRHSHAPSTSFPHRPRHSRTLPRHSREGGNLFPLCITFDKTELPYYHKTMTTQPNHNPRRSPMRETSELPPTSLPHSPTSFPHPTTSLPHSPTSLPHPPTSLPRRRESIPLCIAFDKTELPYYPRPMDTPRNPSPRRHLAIPNPPNSPSTESDRMQHNATGCYENSCPRVTRARARGIPTRHSRTHPRHSPEGGNPPRRLQNPTESNTMLQGATKTRARARGIPTRHSRTHPHHSHTHPRHSREGGNPSSGIDRIRPIARSRRLISLTPIHQTEPI